MPELRKDPVLGRWVIISVERGKRPTDYVQPPKRRKGGFCPFCPGNEYTTPPELLAIRKDGSKPNERGWELRAMSNKFPALHREGDLNKKGEGIYDKMNGVGAHEVIVETPDHNMTLAKMPLEHFEQVLWAYHGRLSSLKQDARVKYVLIFKNEGEAAGASLEHSHTQLIALPIVPRTVKDEMSGARRHYELRDRCLFCDIIYQEMQEGTRVVAENDAFLAIAPFAPRAPFETWLLPKAHYSSFQPLEDRFRSMGELLQTVLGQMDVLLESPAYNFVLHTSPFNEEDNDYYHWHIEIMPKLTKIAGFEWGSGFYMNSTAPEQAAQFMREVKLQPR
jgi:UDPglucose--hexose-1-phosphate uridylyltransferase